MRKIIIFIASAAINASTIPAVAADYTSNKYIDASRTRLDNDNEKICRAYAASFYESVVMRQAAASRVDGERVLAALDSVINAFNDLFAPKCGS
jgi:hypothetical protein